MDLTVAAPNRVGPRGLRRGQTRISFVIEMFDIKQLDIETMSTRFSGTDDERQALDAYIKLMRSTAAINGRLFPPLQAEFGITPSQLGVLEALGHLGPMPHCVLAGKLLLSPSNLTTVVDNLERDGLVRRDRDPNDRRVSITSLTPSGEARLAGFFPHHVRRLVRVMNALEPSEQIELARLCRKLGLAAAGALPHATTV